MSLLFLCKGHIGICVPDVDAACKFFEEKKVNFVKKPNDGEFLRIDLNNLLICSTVFHFSGKMKGLAFIQDPDGYWIEILNAKNMLKIVP